MLCRIIPQGPYQCSFNHYNNQTTKLNLICRAWSILQHLKISSNLVPLFNYYHVSKNPGMEFEVWSYTSPFFRPWVYSYYKKNWIVIRNSSIILSSLLQLGFPTEYAVYIINTVCPYNISCYMKWVTTGHTVSTMSSDNFSYGILINLRFHLILNKCTVFIQSKKYWPKLYSNFLYII